MTFPVILLVTTRNAAGLAITLRVWCASHAAAVETALAYLSRRSTVSVRRAR